MYKTRYSHTNNNGKETSKLVAVFSFDDEIAPSDRKDVKTRLRIVPGNYHCLNEYLGGERFVGSEGIRGIYAKRVGEKVVVAKIRRHCRGLGFTLKMVSLSKMDAEEMVDLERLDEFIKTGKGIKY